MAIYNWSDGELITASKLNSWGSEIEGIKDTASGYADDASTSATNAGTSETNASTSATNASQSEAAALGYKNDAQGYMQSASTSASTSTTNKLDSEAWAVGTRNGVAVDSSDPAYHNNAKYYKEQAGEIVGGDYATKAELTTHTGNTTVHVTSGDKATWNGKANKPTVSATTMATTGWSNSEYSFESTYPAATYNLSIEIDGDNATEEQIEAWSAAKICGSATANKAIAKGDVPAVTIPIILKVVAK